MIGREDFKIDSWWVDAIWVLSLSVWVSFSAWAIFSGDSETFQRFGSFGVACVVAYFAYVRVVQGAKAPENYHEMNNLTSKRISLNTQAVQSALSNTTAIAKVIKDEAAEAQRPINPAISILAGALPHAGKLRHESIKFNEQNAREEEILVQSVGAEKAAHQASTSAEVVQAVVAVVATLLWGFGDLLVDILHGAGS